MRFIGISTEKSSIKARIKESLLRLREMGHIEIYDGAVAKFSKRKIKT